MAAAAGESNGEVEMKILLLGSSGLVGKNVLAQALAHPAVISVVAPTRQPLAPHPKLTNPVSDHLESLLSEGVAWGIDGSSVRWERRSARLAPKRHFVRWTT